MRNIHLIHVNRAKASLYHCSNTRDLFTTEQTPGDLLYELYITSDEEIKDGDWFIRDGSIHKCFRVYKTDIEFLTSIDSVYCGSNTFWSKEYCKKIILTTDQDLIEDGVQPINDEFLEWFVKNPSCERVEVEEVYPLNCCIQKEGKTKMNNGCMERNRCLNYKIIIPNLEIWKDIPDFEGYYQVSNLGNVKSLSRTILGKNDTPTFLKEKMLKFSTSTNGYYQVILCKNSDRKIFKVHSLVAICFLNHIPDGTHNVVIDHINEIKTDNRIENLRLIGHRENVSRSIKDSTSTYVGVSWSKNAKKWISQITIDGKTKYLGLFDNEEDANKKYLETLKDL